MALKLSLVSAPISIEERYGKFKGAANTEPSFALAILAAVAREAGHAVQCVEASAMNLSIEETLKKIAAFNPDVVGISATTAGITSAAKLADKIKSLSASTYTIIGGCHATALPGETLQSYPSFDIAVTGEGEETLVELLAFLDKNQSIPLNIAGTSLRTENNSIKHNPPRPLIHNLDKLPLPAWDLIEGFPRLFRPSPARIKRWPCASIVLTRGCPNACTFCDRSVFGNKCRFYSPSYAVKLINDLRNNYHVKEILIEDDTFILQKKHVQEFCEILIRDKIDVTWSCLGRVDRVTPDLLKLMRKAGCWHIGFGIESGDSAILANVQKNISIDQVKQALHWCREAGIRTKGFFIIGLPGESIKSIEKTRQLILSLELDDISVMQMTPFPGSAFYAEAHKWGSFIPVWEKMNTINTIFIPQGMKKEDLEEGRRRIIRSFYFRPSIILRHITQVVAHPSAALRMIKSIPALFKFAFGK